MLKRFGLLFMSIAVCAVLLSMSYQKHVFMEENDLWKEDGMFRDAGLTEEMFNRIIDIGHKLYKPFADANNETLRINNKWSDSTVNANVSRFFGTVTINMFGGLARRPEVNPEGFALVLCHELGHAYGGTPYLSAWQKMSAEGQADYYGAMECHHKLMDILKLEGYDIEPTTYMESVCEENFEGDRAELCVRDLVGGQSLGHLLSVMKEEAIPNYETPDPYVTDKTMTSYPKTIQCRLDTYLNGSLKANRPACWFKD